MASSEAKRAKLDNGASVLKGDDTDSEDETTPIREYIDIRTKR